MVDDANLALAALRALARSCDRVAADDRATIRARSLRWRRVVGRGAVLYDERCVQGNAIIALALLLPRTECADLRARGRSAGHLLLQPRCRASPGRRSGAHAVQLAVPRGLDGRGLSQSRLALSECSPRRCSS